jgi:hypothetical protein
MPLQVYALYCIVMVMEVIATDEFMEWYMSLPEKEHDTVYAVVFRFLTQARSKVAGIRCESCARRAGATS